MPGFVRASYMEFAKLFSNVADFISVKYSSNPYQAASAAKALSIGATDIIALAKNLASNNSNGANGNDIINVILSDICKNTEVNGSFETISADEAFFVKNSQDIYAPLKKIRLAVTPFTGFDDINSTYVYKTYGLSKIPIAITISDTFRYGENLTRTNSLNEIHLGGFDIEDSMGADTVLDRLCSVCYVDINQLFACFLENLSDRFNRERDANNNDSSKVAPGMGKLFFDDKSRDEDAVCDREVSRLIKIAKEAMDPDNSELIRGVIESVTDVLVTSAVMTYLVFAAKIVGAKPDVFSWAYKAFIKDEMNHFDIANYPTAADVASFTGKASDGEGNIQTRYTQDGAINEALSEAHIAQDSEYSRSQKAFVYRNIKLKFSSWSAVINALFATHCSKGNKAYFSQDDIGYLHNITECPFTLMADHRRNPTFNALYYVANTALVQFLRCKYRTYNTTIQISKNSDIPCSSNSMIKPVVSLIRDEEARVALKNCLGLSNNKSDRSKLMLDDIMILHDAKVETILKFNESATTKVGNIFLRIAYLILMNYTHINMGNVISQKDPITGKTWGQIYDEIYYGLAKSISDELKLYGKYPSMSSVNIDYHSNRTFNDSLTLLTPYLKDNLDRISIDGFGYESSMPNTYFGRFGGKIVNYNFGWTANDKIPEYFKKVAEFIQDKKNKRTIRNLGHSNFDVVVEDISDVPYISECYAIRLDFDCDFGSIKDNDIVLQSPVNADGSLFPKHRLLTEAISRLTPSVKRSFVSLESMDSAISTIESLTNVGLEGADGMANNSCYSVFGALGGPVESLEITNEMYEKDGERKPRYVVETTNFISPLGPTVDGDGNLTGGVEAATVDQKKFTSSESSGAFDKIDDIVSMKKRKEIIERYNTLFNRLIAN